MRSPKSVPVKNAKGLIALAREKPGTLNYGSAGVGSVNHMAMELLKSPCAPRHQARALSGRQCGGERPDRRASRYVRRKPAANDRAGAGGHGATGIAVTGTNDRARFPICRHSPNPGCRVTSSSNGGGSSCPRARHATSSIALNAELNRILATAEIKAFMAHEGAQPTPSTPEAFGRHLSMSLRAGHEVVKSTGIGPSAVELAGAATRIRPRRVRRSGRTRRRPSARRCPDS